MSASVEPRVSDPRIFRRRRQAASGRLLSLIKQSWPAVFMAVVVMVAWALARPVFGVAPYLLPTPKEVCATFIDRWPSIWSATLVTSYETAVGFALSVVVGIALGVGVSWSVWFSRAVYPYLIASQGFPKIALAPLLVVWFGLGIQSKVIMAFLIAFFPIVVGTIVGIRSVDRDAIMLSRSIGMGRFRTLFVIQFPSALPSIFGGLKVATSLALVGAVVGEFVAASEGLGYLLTSAMATINTGLLFAVLFMLSLLGIILYGAMSLLEYLLMPWRRRTKVTRKPMTLESG